MTKRPILEIITALLVLLFVYASVSKLMDYRSFHAHLEVTPYMRSFAGLLSVILPLGELLIVVLLLQQQTRFVGMWLSFITMMVFTVYVALMLLTQQHLPCTCGGFIQKLSWPQHLILNITFTIISLAGIILHNLQSTDDVGRDHYVLSVRVDDVEQGKSFITPSSDNAISQKL